MLFGVTKLGSGVFRGLTADFDSERMVFVELAHDRLPLTILGANKPAFTVNHQFLKLVPAWH